MIETLHNTVDIRILMIVWCVWWWWWWCWDRGGGVKLVNVNSGFSKIHFDNKSVVVIMCLVLILAVFQVTLSNHHHVLTLVSWYYMTSFNYGDKTAKDVGLTCSNIMPNSIFYDSMGWGKTFFFFFFFLWIKKIDICFSKAILNNVNKIHFLQFPLIKRPWTSMLLVGITS